MKKLVLVLAMALIAVPSFGAFTISLLQQGTSAVYDVNYVRTGTDANLPRAFALVVNVTGGATISDVTNYKLNGESTAASKGFGIYPGTISINDVNGHVNSYGTPVAPATYAGAAGTGIGTSTVVLEMGSLYVGDGNAPAASGRLCSVTLDCGSATGTQTLSLSLESAFRGGLVLENGAQPTPTLVGSTYTGCSCTPAPVAVTTPTPSNGATGVAITTDLSWSPAAGGTNPRYDVYFGTTSPGTLVSSNQTATTYDTGTMANSQTYYWKIVSKNDCNSVGVSSSVFNFTTVAACTQPVAATTPTPADGAIVEVKVLPTATYPTLSWTPAAGGTNPKYDVYFGLVNPPVTVVSANQTTTSYVATSVVQGKTYYWKIVSKNDCNPTGVSSIVWNFNTNCYKSTGAGVATWEAQGKPSCWCFRKQCNGDGNGASLGGKPVTLADFTNFQAAYNKANTLLKNQIDSNGKQLICADYNHASLGGKPVTLADFNLFQPNYNKANTMVPACASTNTNFWTN